MTDRPLVALKAGARILAPVPRLHQEMSLAGGARGIVKEMRRIAALHPDA